MMKRILGAAIVLAVGGLLASSVSGQRRITSPDGHAATEIRGHYEGAEEPVYVGGKWIEISYERPIRRGRYLWGSGAADGKYLNWAAEYTPLSCFGVSPAHDDSVVVHL